MSSPSLLLCFRLSHLLAFYNSTIRHMLDEEAQLVQMLKVLLLLMAMMMLFVSLLLLLLLMMMMMMMWLHLTLPP